MKSDLKSLAESLVKRLTDNPSSVKVDLKEEGSALIFEARAAKEDRGKIIGKKGKTIDALRALLGACGVKEKKRCSFQIIEDDDEK